MKKSRRLFPVVLLAAFLTAPVIQAQTAPSAPATAAPAEAPRDALGRDNPRGTVLGFIAAARKGDEAITPQYLDTNLSGQDAVDLARMLYVVLDSRLPTRLNALSDRPEGALANPLKPDQDVVGTISTAFGPLDIVVERVTRRGSRPVWLFSRQTLDSIPDVFDEIDLVSVDRYLPGFLTKPQIGGIRLFEWLTFILVLPFFYRLLGLLNRALSPVAALWPRRFRRLEGKAPDLLSGPIRLLVLAVVIRWSLGTFDLPLLERQFWSVIVALFTIAAVVWLALRLNAYGERYVNRRLRGTTFDEVAPLLRLAHRVADGIVVLVGGLVALRFFGIDATAALAGLGIGGIAVALAAQKTLENVIGGLSLVFDKVVRVGDFLKVGETVGTVDHIGLRSTRIRTLDRTLVSVPNGQIASVSIETLSARDKFWFHHFVALRYETTSVQMRSVIEGFQNLLVGYPGVDFDSIRVRFLRLGEFSLDIEIFAYIFASDWGRFLAIQEELLLRVMEVVEAAGTEIAFPSQTLHVANAREPASIASRAESTPATRR